jgi:hypothetical protein
MMKKLLATLFVVLILWIASVVRLAEDLQHEQQLNKALQSRIDNIVTPNEDCTADEDMPNRELINQSATNSTGVNTGVNIVAAAATVTGPLCQGAPLRSDDICIGGREYIPRDHK